MLIGPFFYIPKQKRIICNACDVRDGILRSGKYDNPYGHEQLWDDYFSNGEYILYPRGRVIYDDAEKKAIIYIDKCIDKPAVIQKLKSLFKIDIPVSVEYDFHYQCVICQNNIWDEG